MYCTFYHLLILILNFSPLLINSEPHHRAPSPAHFATNSRLAKRINRKSANDVTTLSSSAINTIQNIIKKDYSGPEATVKCLTLYTWALCVDLERNSCTDMGPVADGTMCVDNAMTWSGTESGPVVPSVYSSSTPIATSTSASVPAVTEAPTILLESSTSIPTSSTSATTASLDDSVDDGDDDDGECVAGEVDTSTDVFTPVVAASTTSISVESSTSVSVALDSSTATVTSTSDSIVLSTSTEALTIATAKLIAIRPVATSKSKPQTTISSTSDGPFSDGVATFFTQDGGIGACGHSNPDSAYIVALQIDRFGTGSNNAPDCGRKVKITNRNNGKSITAIVADACPGCLNVDSLDLSVGAFNALANPDVGVFPIVWSFIS